MLPEPRLQNKFAVTVMFYGNIIHMVSVSNAQTLAGMLIPQSREKDDVVMKHAGTLMDVLITASARVQLYSF